MKLGILGTGMIVHDLMQTYHELHIEKSNAGYFGGVVCMGEQRLCCGV